MTAPRIPDREVCCGVAFERAPGRCGGDWVLDGTRMTVGTIDSLYVSGLSPDAIQKLYPHLTTDQIEAAIALPTQLGARWVPCDQADDDGAAQRGHPRVDIHASADWHVAEGHGGWYRALGPSAATPAEALAKARASATPDPDLTFRRIARNAVAGFVDGDDEGRYERAIESVQAACRMAYERGLCRESPQATLQTILNTLKGPDGTK